jgi:hypothetical protein
MTHLMAFKSKYSFSNKCYNNIVKLIIDTSPRRKSAAKHNMSKDLYQSKKIVSSLGINYEKIVAYKKIACCFGRSIRMTPNVCIVVGPDT